MAVWRLITLALAASIIVEAESYQKRETPTNICDLAYNNKTKVQCYCVTDTHYPNTIRSAECHLARKGIQADDENWNGFEKVKETTKLTFSNTRGIPLNYIPTNVFQSTPKLLKLEIKFGNIEKLEPFAFGNLTLVEYIILSNNEIKTLSVNAFSHHRDLIFIGLDSNEIVEINRNVFVDLPSLEKLFLTNNKITTIHDKAFVHLTNLRELEIDRNSLFSLNSETFSGLSKLQHLDLSFNNLEVIGDNTFLPLRNLNRLNLESNKIQMLDEKAFHGLKNLFSLNLAHNNLSKFENVKVFEGLPSLTNLNLKSNQLMELKSEVMAPILNNLYGNSSHLDVDDNKMPCDCRLEWFMSLMNETQSQSLKAVLDNLKCIPSERLKELWTTVVDTEKETQALEEDVQDQNNNYEYYDETQLDGKLFYTDVRDLANCTKKADKIIPVSNEIAFQTSTIGINTKATIEATLTTLTTSKPLFSSKDNLKTLTTVKPIVTATVISSVTKTTTKTTSSLKPNELVKKPMEENETKFKDLFTTNRFATVSAKPSGPHVNFVDQNMASDEARPDRIKAHRSIQDDNAPEYKGNNAGSNICNVFIIAIMLSFRLCF